MNREIKMGWADPYIEKLKAGESVQFRPRGNSMSPKIRSGQLVTVEGLTGWMDGWTKGDIVLCKVGGKQFLHFIKGSRIHNATVEYLIGNNKGGTNGWTNEIHIYGRVTKIEN